MALFEVKKELTEMDRVVENIRQAEADVNQKIFELGKAYYEDHKADIDTESKYYAMIDMINKAEENRKNFFKSKLRLEGQMLCDNCGGVIALGSIFCNFCGTKMPEEAPVVAAPAPNPVCKNCGKPLDEGAVFCGACGTKVE